MEIETGVGVSVFVELAPGTIASDYALKNLSKALGEAQNEFLPSVKSVENEYAHYDYVPLEAIVASVRPSLCKYHLTVSQFPVTDLATKTIAIYGRLVHWDSGEWMQSMLELPAEMAIGKDGVLKFNHQTIGGSQTYGMKYQYKSIVGIPDSEGDPDSKDESGDLKARSTKNKKTLCPVCGKDAIIQGKPEYGGGWLCYKAKGGCGWKTDTNPALVQESHEPAGAPATQIPAQPATQAPPAQQTGKIGPTKRIPASPPDDLPGFLCTVKRIKESPKKGSVNACISVVFDEVLNGENQGQTWVAAYATCWHASLFDAIRKSVGKECQFAIKERDAKLNNSDEWPTHFVDIEDVISISDPATGDYTEYTEGKPVPA
jgi:hypothetical protein